MMKQYDNVEVAIWIAAGILTYNTYYKSLHPQTLTKNDVAFSQSRIRKVAETICTKQVNTARIYQHYNADHQDNTHNYLRNEGNLKRITYPGELNGDREMPKNINLNDAVVTEQGEITLRELVEFLNTEYRDIIIGTNIHKLKYNIKFKDILEFLRDYAGTRYTKPEKVENPVEKQSMIELSDLAKVRVGEFKEIGEACKMGRFTFKPQFAGKWLDGSNTKIRRYFWIELKKPGKEQLSSSISIFAEKEGSVVRFRVSLEMRDDESNEQDYLRHHRYLEILDPRSVDFEYFGSRNKDLNIEKLTPEEVLGFGDKILKREVNKLQMGKTIRYEKVISQSNEETLRELREIVEQLEPYYNKSVGTEENEALQETEGQEGKKDMFINDKNLILYGPPGTGKTYNTVNYAVAICDDLSLEEVQAKPYEEVLVRYNQLIEKERRIAFTTFHQAYAYEEFIEGIKPVVEEDEAEGNLLYKKEDGIFKTFCKRAAVSQIKYDGIDIPADAKMWKVTIKEGSMNPIKKECFEEGHVRIGFGMDEPQARVFVEEMGKGDIIISFKDRKTIDGIGILIDDEAYKIDGKETYEIGRNIKWLTTNIAENIVGINGDRLLARKTVSGVPHMKIEDVLKLVQNNGDESACLIEGESKEQKNYVFIIDEINRGNISKIFGELITLIETTKRHGKAESMSAVLPYTGEHFSVPSNVYILGTMNTADRSIALMDTALRRRFKFIEMMPQADILTNLGVDEIDGVDVVKMLKVINERIEYLYDREHTIGHAYFTALKEDPSLTNLASIFENAIIPLLQEYFYEDYSKIRMVLGDNGKEEVYQFIRATDVTAKSIFKGDVSEIEELDNKRYEIQQEAFNKKESYISIYA